jgi:hypothetical protein
MERAEKDGRYLKIMVDDNAQSPREDDNLGTMVCWHRRHALGDDHKFSEPRDFMKSLAGQFVTPISVEEQDEGEPWIGDSDGFEEFSDEELQAVIEANVIILPLMLYEHSGMSISTRSFIGRAQHAERDSGQVGWIYCSRERFLSETGYSAAELFSRAEEMLKSEVETYDNYLQNEVYGYQYGKMVKSTWKCEDTGETEIETEDEEEESCWGFYGSDHEKSGLADNQPEEYRELLSLLSECDDE